MIFTRIDDRLVHGQVVQGWLPFLGSDEVVVVSDDAAADETRKILMRISLQEEIALKVLTVGEAAQYLKAGAGGGETLVLTPGPAEVARLAELGVGFESVNVGGMHHAVGKAQIGRAIFLSEADKAALKAISARGIKLEGRAVPGDAPEDIARAL
ncbi:MAG: PTS sugar transporter subunit IIB [Elusimicrobiales bacterium]